MKAGNLSIGEQVFGFPTELHFSSMCSITGRQCR